MDKRPVPNIKEGLFLRENKCSDRLYVYLLLKSKHNPNGRETHRYIEKMTNIQISEELGISRQTVGKHLNELIKYGYVTREGKYYLVPKTDYYALIPVDTLNFLINYVPNKDKIIKLYIALFDCYNA